MHNELFEKLANRLPQELLETRKKLQERLGL